MRALVGVAITAALLGSGLTWIAVALFGDPREPLPPSAEVTPAVPPTAPSRRAEPTAPLTTSLDARDREETALLRDRLAALETRVAELEVRRAPVAAGAPSETSAPDLRDLIDEVLKRRAGEAAARAEEDEREEWQRTFERDLRADLALTAHDLELSFDEGEIEVLAEIFTEVEWRRRDLQEQFRSGELTPQEAADAQVALERYQRDEVTAHFGVEIRRKLFGD